MALQEERTFPRLIVAAPQGRSGKTTVTLGLCMALSARGLTVQPFKKGPDYIDPSWLSEAAGHPCRSLDPFFYEKPEDLLRAFVRPAQQADLSIVEGNHGLFDSFDETGVGSTAAVARILDAPIFLVVNATRIGRSVAAIVHGCQTFEPGIKIAGVVLNNIAHGRHEARTRQAIESHCGIPVVGAIPRNEKLTIPDRHLGLIPREEEDSLLSAITTCQEAVERHLDLDTVLEIARSASALPVPEQTQNFESSNQLLHAKIGILRDRAFTFYYPENLEALETAGAELVFINAFHDTELPLVDALYIGGGFPEIFMEELSANVSLRVTIKEAIENDLPVYAECGGLMYLSQRIRWGENSAEMVGALPCEVEMTGKPQGHGYVVAQVENETPFFKIGTVLRGHEFHNSHLATISVNGSKNVLATAYQLSRGNGIGESRDGVIYRNVLASYAHLHCGGAPDWAKELVHRAKQYQETHLGVGGEVVIQTMPILMVGLNHKVASVEVRERLAFGSEQIPFALNRITQNKTSRIKEVVLLSTCNRTEVYICTCDSSVGEKELKNFLAGHAKLAPERLQRMCYVLRDEAVAEHLMQVAAGLDSLVLGENEILGQVRSAAEIAHDAGTTGPILSALFRYAIQAGKRARAETKIGHGDISVASVVVEMAEQAFGPLNDRTALLIGAGKISAITARALVKAGLRCVMIANRTFEKAQKLAKNLNGTAVHFDVLDDILMQADIVICSTGAPHIVLHADAVEKAQKIRYDRPLLIADLAVPRDADPRIVSIPGVQLVNIDDLDVIVKSSHPLTASIYQEVEAIVREELEDFCQWCNARRCAPIIRALHSKAESIYHAEVEQTLRRLGPLTPQQQHMVEAMGKAIANKLLHEPTIRLREMSPDEDSSTYIELIQELYRIQ